MSLVRFRPWPPPFLSRFFLLHLSVGLAALCLASTAASGEEIRGAVTSVASGDSLTIFSAGVSHRVRLVGVDAPKKGQRYAARSWQNLMQLAYGREATLECQNVVRYKQRMCKVKVQPLSCPACGHTLDVGLAQILAGAAWWSREDASAQSEEDRGRYESEEIEARLRRRGLWAATTASIAR